MIISEFKHVKQLHFECCDYLFHAVMNEDLGGGGGGGEMYVNVIIYKEYWFNF